MSRLAANQALEWTYRAKGCFWRSLWAPAAATISLESQLPVTSEAELPNVGAILGAVLQRVPAAQRPLLIALAERLAAERYRVFAERPLELQFAIQARGERLGAATWRSLAQDAGSEEVRQTFLGCARPEEESASYLESLLRGGV